MRALYAVTASLLAASAWVTFFACSNTTDTVAGDGDGGTGGTSGGQGGTSGGTSGTSGGTSGSTSCGSKAPSLADGGVAPNGCKLFSTGVKCGATAENVTRTDITGGVDWTNPSGALTEDNQSAKVVINDGQESSFLRVKDFGFTFPPNAETWGIVVRLERQVLEDGGRLRTSKVDVQIATKTTEYKFDNPDFYWPIPIVGKHDYGQAVDTWGADLNPGDFTPATFAAILSVKKWDTGGLAGPITGIVDALKAEIWYADGDAQHCTK
jgi:hypothetical protein